MEAKKKTKEIQMADGKEIAKTFRTGGGAGSVTTLENRAILENMNRKYAYEQHMKKLEEKREKIRASQVGSVHNMGANNVTGVGASRQAWTDVSAQVVVGADENENMADDEGDEASYYDEEEEAETSEEFQDALDDENKLREKQKQMQKEVNLPSKQIQKEKETELAESKKKVFDPRTDNILNITPDDINLNRSLKNFAPPEDPMLALQHLDKSLLSLESQLP